MALKELMYGNILTKQLSPDFQEFRRVQDKGKIGVIARARDVNN